MMSHDLFSRQMGFKPLTTTSVCVRLRSRIYHPWGRRSTHYNNKTFGPVPRHVAGQRSCRLTTCLVIKPRTCSHSCSRMLHVRLFPWSPESSCTVAGTAFLLSFRSHENVLRSTFCSRSVAMCYLLCACHICTAVSGS